MCLCSSLFSPGEEAAGHACVCLCVCYGCCSESKDVFWLSLLWQLICSTLNVNAVALINITAGSPSISALQQSDRLHNNRMSSTLFFFFFLAENKGAFGCWGWIHCWRWVLVWYWRTIVVSKKVLVNHCKVIPEFASFLGDFSCFCLCLSGLSSGSLDSPQSKIR